MCPIETPEGPNIGLIGALATFARVNEFGFIESPYRKVVDGQVTDEIVYLAADEEEEYVVAQANAPLNADGTFKDEPRPRAALAAGRLARATCKLQLERDVFFGATTEISLRAAGRGPAHGRLAEADRLGGHRAHPVPRARRRQPRPHGRQHAEAGRAAGAGRGALHRHRHRGPRRPRRRRHDPRRGRRHGHRGRRRRASPSSTRRRAARSTGCSSSSGRTRTPASTRSRVVREGDKVKKGDILADGPSTDNGELALGKNLLVAFMPWEGYNFEDAIILSRAPGEGRRAHVDPHPRARDRRPRHQARPRGDHPGHPEPLRGDPRATSTSAASSASAPRSAPATCSSARSRPRARPSSPRRSACCGPSSVRRPARSATPASRCPTARRARSSTSRCSAATSSHELPPGRQPAGAGLRRPEAQDQRGRQARRPPRQQGRHLQDPARSRTCRSWPTARPSTSSSTRSACPSRMNVGQVLEAHLGYARPLGLGRRRRRRSATSRSAAPRPRPAPTRRRRRSSPRRCSTAPTGTRTSEAGKHPTIQQILENLQPESASTATRLHRRRRQDHALQRPHRRALRQPDHGRLRLHPEAGPPRRRQDPRPVDRPVLDDHPAAAGREGAVRWPALRRDGGVGPRGLRRRLLPAGAAHHQVRRRARPGEGLRGHRQGREHPRARHPRELQGAHQGDAGPVPQRRGPLRRPASEIEMRELDEDVFRTAEELGIDLSRPERGSRRRRRAPAPSGRGARLSRCSTSTTSISFASAWPRPTRSARGPTARSRSRRPSTTARSSRRRTGSSARRSSVRPRTGSATAASTSASGSRASSASAAASRSPARRSGASAWATSSWPRPSCTSGTSAAPARGWPTCSWAPRSVRSSRPSSSRRSSTSPPTWSPGSTTRSATPTCPNLEAELLEELRRDRARSASSTIDRRFKELEEEVAELEKEGAKDAELKARQQAGREGRSPRSASGTTPSSTSLQRAFDEFRDLLRPQDHRRRAAVARAAGPLRRVLRGRHGRRRHQASSSTASTSTRKRSSSATPSTRRRASARCRPSASRRPSSG